MAHDSRFKRIHRKIIDTGQVCDAWCRERRMYDRVLPTAFLSGVLIFLLYFITLAPPLNFPTATLVKVPQGKTVKEIAQILKDKHVIRSTLMFEVVQKLFDRSHPLIAGEYFFSGPQTVVTVASRLSSGDHEVAPIRVTVPEGATAKEITLLIDAKVPDFDQNTFFKLAKPKEGMLFPDTYFFMPGEDADLVLTAFENNFKQHVQAKNIEDAITKFGKPLNDVLTMASLLEKEASDTKSREMISGILWRRIALGMPLQVDAVFPYIIGKNSLQLTHTDLQVDSPYNTYTHKGLPPGPIANPSLDAIVAAVTPTKSNYLFYLSDLHGILHYCVSYTCQQANQARYLNN